MASISKNNPWALIDINIQYRRGDCHETTAFDWNFSALAGMWAAFGIGEIIPVSQAEPVKPSKIVKTEYQYAAKVACSLLQPHQDGSLARGTYRTAVNIHNPTNKEITIAAKVALATEFGSEAGPFAVTPFKEAILQPDGAVGVNCFDIAGYFCPIDGVCVDFAFLEGFLVVKSPVELDVVGVYTAAYGGQRGIHRRGNDKAAPDSRIGQDRGRGTRQSGKRRTSRLPAQRKLRVWQ